MMKPICLLAAIGLTVAAMAITGCQSRYGQVVEPPSSRYSPVMFGEGSPEKAHTAPAFVEFFNEEMRRNPVRVDDWPDAKVLRLRLPGIEVGDGTAIYKSQRRFPPDNKTSLQVTCTFADAAESREINNGDTVDLEGTVAIAKRGAFRIIVELEPCYRIEYEN